MISAIDSAFFAAYAQWIDVPKTVRTAKTPLDMIVADDPTSAGWVEWRLLQCDRERVARALDELERDSRIRYPPSFRRWYSTYYTLDMDVSVARLPDNPSNAPGQSLRRISSDSFGAAALACGLVPFGGEAMMDAGPLCFDPRGGGDPDGWPIRFWDHEWAGTDEVISPIVFSRFDRLLEACTAYMRRFAEVRRRASTGEARAEGLQALIASDPQGAGGPGCDYWSHG